MKSVIDISEYSSESNDSSELGFFSSSSSSENTSDENDSENNEVCWSKIDIFNKLNEPQTSASQYGEKSTPHLKSAQLIKNVSKTLITDQIIMKDKSYLHLDDCDSEYYTLPGNEKLLSYNINSHNACVTDHSALCLDQIEHIPGLKPFSFDIETTENSLMQPQYTICKLCQKPIQPLDTLNKQNKAHWESEHYCISCRKTIGERHINSSKDKKMYCCTICKAAFTSKLDCHQHKLKHVQKRVHKCKICSKEFHRPYQLMGHLQVHKNDKQFECKECGCFYAYRTSLLRHNSKYHSSNAKTFQCDQCGELFRNRRLLNSHVVLHTAKKVIKCIECNRMFKYYSSLKRHKIQMHQGIKPYKCLYCSKTFRSSSYLKIHTGLHLTQKI